jgi:predicted enzyme related to lactoylglutathione lyase
MTPDVDKSVDFYTKLFGWTTEDWKASPESPNYKVVKNGEETIGGFMALDSKAGLPPHWISYVAVDNIEEAMKRAESAGGTIGVPPTEIPNIGRFAVIKDPTGGYISPFQSASDPVPESDTTPVGNFIWEELLSTEPTKAAGFYGNLFGWSTEEMDMGEMGTYRVQKRGEIGEAGIMQKPADSPGPSSWLSYIHVDDVDASATQVTELGGGTVVEPFEIPNIGRMSVHSDPVGGMFALYKPAG